MCEWLRWKQRESVDSKVEQARFRWTFLFQMVNIGGEMLRILRNREKLERIRSDMDYVGEPQIIQGMFETVKKDPKNIALFREIKRAEEETFAFLSGAPDAPTAEEVKEYWSRYDQAYIEELEQKDGIKTAEQKCFPKAYFVCVGDDENYDSAEWIGIYWSASRAREAYDLAVARLQAKHAKMKAYDSKALKYTLKHEKVMVHTFDEKENKWSYDVNPAKLFKNSFVAEIKKENME